MGVDVATFQFLLEGFSPLWDRIPVRRVDVQQEGTVRLGRRSLDVVAGCG